MRKYPQRGELWQHSQGWTVTVIRFTSLPVSAFTATPEFSQEVLYRYDSDGQVTSAPLAWFEESYTRVSEPPRRNAEIAGGQGGFSPLALHPSVQFERWRERVVQQPAEPDASHYSNYL